MWTVVLMLLGSAGADEGKPGAARFSTWDSTCEPALVVRGQDLCADGTLEGADGSWVSAQWGWMRFWTNPDAGDEVRWGGHPCSAFNLSPEQPVRELTVSIVLPPGRSRAWVWTPMGGVRVIDQSGQLEGFGTSANCSAPMEIFIAFEEPKDDAIHGGPASASAACSTRLAPLSPEPVQLACREDGTLRHGRVAGMTSSDTAPR